MLPPLWRRILVTLMTIGVLTTIFGLLMLSNPNYDWRRVIVLVVVLINFALSATAFVMLLTGRIPGAVLAVLQPVHVTIMLVVFLVVSLYLLILAIFLVGWGPSLTYDAAINWVQNTLAGLLLGWGLAWGAAIYFRI